MVVDDVEFADLVEAAEGVAQVRERLADLLARRMLEDGGKVSLGMRVAGGEERHVVAGVSEPVGEQRDDPFDPAVAARRGGEPDRTEDGDPHRVHHERKGLSPQGTVPKTVPAGDCPKDRMPVAAGCPDSPLPGTVPTPLRW